MDSTLLSISFHSEKWLDLNQRLTSSINERSPQWIVEENADVPKTVPRQASLHHAMALNRGLERIKSRFVFVIDPDFFVIKKDWIAQVEQKMKEEELWFLGAPWHPRWSWQPQQFPCPHFLCVDLNRVDKGFLDFTPDLKDFSWEWQKRQKWIPGFVKEIWRRRRFRDTGWKIFSRFHAQTQRYVNLTPVVTEMQKPVLRNTQRFLPLVESLLPPNLKKTPKGLLFSKNSFLQNDYPEGYRRGWEEFLYQNEPFAVHLRRYGRQSLRQSLADDSEIDSLEKYLKLFF